MQDIKNYFDRKFNKQAKQTEEMKSGIEFALNKEIEQYRKRIFALEKSLGERDKILHLLFNKIPNQKHKIFLMTKGCHGYQFKHQAAVK